MDMAVLVLAWITWGLFMVSWLTRREGEHTDALFIAFLLVYFGVPLLAVVR
jgi:hypothetical protein